MISILLLWGFELDSCGSWRICKNMITIKVSSCKNISFLHPGRCSSFYFCLPLFFLSINTHRIWEIENWGTPRRRHNKIISIHLIVSRCCESGRAAKTLFYLAFSYQTFLLEKDPPSNFHKTSPWCQINKG